MTLLTDVCVCRPTGPADGSESGDNLSDAVMYDVTVRIAGHTTRPPQLELV